MKIGIFDSGIGGLSIAQQLLQTNNVHLVYIADTANMPFGNKSPDEIRRLSKKIVETLIEHQVDYIIIACHTVSAIAGPYLASSYPQIFFITMLEAVIPQAVAATKNNRIGIIATPATIRNQLHKHALQYLNNRLTVIEQPCQTLATTIEHQWQDSSAIYAAIDQYILPLRTKSIDTLILGCTHYALVKQQIKECIGTDITLITAEDSIEQLIVLPSGNLTTSATIECLVSGDIKKFELTIQTILAPFIAKGISLQIRSFI